MKFRVSYTVTYDGYVVVEAPDEATAEEIVNEAMMDGGNSFDIPQPHDSCDPDITSVTVEEYEEATL